MLKPEIHSDETVRLQALYDYQILNTEPESAFDDLTFLASVLFEVPTVLISLIEKDRQWFKSRIGLGVHETSRDVSFCAHAILQKEMLVVEDARKDIRFHDNPLVTGAPHIRFYAGAVLWSPTGLPLGTLCIIDNKPREFTEKQKVILGTLARQVVDQMELRKSNLMLRKNVRHLQEANRMIYEQQSKLVNAAQLASLGEMASAIAHEINNPLSIIIGNLVLIKRNLTKELGELGKNGDYMKSIELTVHRIAKIVRGLRAFARNGEQDPFEECDLQEIVDHTITLFREKTKMHGVEFREPSFVENLVMECRPVQLGQILINLLNNSFDAVKNLEEKWIDLNIQAADGHICIAVTDSGNGIPADLQHKIMQPFFTTKNPREGAGLGLSISKNIAEEHNGKLEIDNASKKTRFILTLPRKQQA